MTIASACMAVYRSLHIKKDSIGMIPTQGYLNRTNFSRDSIRWMDFLMFKEEGLEIEHAMNGRGERKIHGISVDGYCEKTNTIYQYHVSFQNLIKCNNLI